MRLFTLQLHTYVPGVPYNRAQISYGVCVSYHVNVSALLSERRRSVTYGKDRAVARNFRQFAVFVLDYDGLFISNGPGDPDTCDAAVQNIRKAMQNEKLPIFGICMGNQLLSKAGGAKIYKLKYGHRSHNQPVRMVGTEKCFITSQNHGYAVDNNTLGTDWEPLFINMNDGSNEGIRHKKNPWFSAQFHPEAASGPTDTEFLFDEFVKLL